jgi:hypothetical protein
MVNVDMENIGSLKEAYDTDEKINSTGGGFFTELKDDGDTAVVRFLYKDDKDVDFAFVHSVKINEKSRYVKCKGKDCPLCESIGKPKLRLFLQVYHNDEVKLWERGKTFIPKFIRIAERFNPIYNYEFEVIRNGKKGDTKTNYEIFKVEDSESIDESVLEKKSSIVDGKNGFVLDLNMEEMKEVINGEFELKKSQGDKEPEKRRKPVDEEEVF